jgi:hypothetical protein
MFRTPIRLACASLMVLAGCSTGPDDTSRVTVLLKDAPGDVLEAVVTIDRIYLQGGEDAAAEGTEAESQEAGQVILLDEPVTVDLLTLADQWMTLVDGVEVPSSQYGQLRFVISGAYIKVETETGEQIFASSPDYAGLPAGAEVTGELQMPSFAQSGLKVNFQGGLSLQSESTLLVDFDVAESFGKEAGSGMWVMHPVLNGTTGEEAPAATSSR